MILWNTNYPKLTPNVNSPALEVISVPIYFYTSFTKKNFPVKTRPQAAFIQQTPSIFFQQSLILLQRFYVCVVQTQFARAVAKKAVINGAAS